MTSPTAISSRNTSSWRMSAAFPPAARTVASISSSSSRRRSPSPGVFDHPIATTPRASNSSANRLRSPARTNHARVARATYERLEVGHQLHVAGDVQRVPRFAALGDAEAVDVALDHLVHDVLRTLVQPAVVAPARDRHVAHR